MPFSEGMFFGKDKKMKALSKNRFAEEIRHRCSAEIKAAIRQCEHLKAVDRRKRAVQDLLVTTPFALAKCYQNDHSYCEKHTFTCNPEQNKYWDKFCLPEAMKTTIEMTEKDEMNLLVSIRVRLGVDAVAKTFDNISTNKCEAMNRAYSKTHPKNNPSSTNFKARILSAVLVNNLGLEEACHVVHEAIGHKVCQNVQLKIKSHSDDILKRKESQKSLKAKVSRINRRKEKYNLHNQIKMSGVAKSSVMLDADDISNASNDESEPSISYPYQSGMDVFTDIDPRKEPEVSLDDLSMPGPSSLNN